MSSLTNYAENRIIDAMLRGQSLTFPATWHLALFSAAPTDSSLGTEVVAPDYGRVAIAANLANWYGTQGGGSILVSDGTSGITSNVNDLLFPTPATEWGLVVAAGLWDAATAGNLWMFCSLQEAKSIFINDIVHIPQASLVIRLDD